MSIGMDFDLKTFGVSIPVTVKVYSELVSEKLTKGELDPSPADRRAIIDKLIELGFRAQLRTGKLPHRRPLHRLRLIPKCPKAKVDWSRQPSNCPTVPGELQGIEQSLTNIVKKLEKLPLEAIGNDLRKALVTLTRRLRTPINWRSVLNADVIPETKGALAEARRTLQAAERALGSANTVLLGPDAPVQQETPRYPTGNQQCRPGPPGAGGLSRTPS